MLFLNTCKSIYDKSPAWLKAPVGWLPLSIVLGSHYRRQRDFLNVSSNWSREQLLHYQKKALFDMVEYAATSTPYYRAIFKELDLPARLTSLDQFFKIPLIDKQKIKKLGADIFSDKLTSSQRYKVMTGGTSGSPLSLFMSSEAYGREWAFVHELLARYGVKANDKKLCIRGVPIMENNDGNYILYNSVYKELQISPFHLTEKIISKEVEKIINFKPVYLHGYPSAIEMLAKLSINNSWGRKLNLKCVMTISETLYPQQKKIIEDAFDCEVLSFYGHTERLTFAGNYPGEDGFVVDPRYGFTEIIDDELIGTGFINKATPLLRYRTGDLTTRLAANEAATGLLNMTRIGQVEGRWRQEMLVGKTGAKISITALNMHSDIFKNVGRFQFYQDQPGVVELKIVPMEAFCRLQDVKSIMQGFKNKLGNELDVLISLVKSIELTGRQKQLFLIQKLNVSE